MINGLDHGHLWVEHDLHSFVIILFFKSYLPIILLVWQQLRPLHLLHDAAQVWYKRLASLWVLHILRTGLMSFAYFADFADFADFAEETYEFCGFCVFCVGDLWVLRILRNRLMSFVDFADFAEGTYEFCVFCGFCGRDLWVLRILRIEGRVMTMDARVLSLILTTVYLNV